MAATPSGHAQPPPTAPADGPASGKYNGQLLGLPQSGPGSMATIAGRLGAVLIDWVISYGLAYLVMGSDVTTKGQFAVLSILALCYLIGLAVNGSTFGMALLGIRVNAETGGKAAFSAIVLRTILLFVAIPAILTDADGRPFHDKLAKTVTVKSR